MSERDKGGQRVRIYGQVVESCNAVRPSDMCHRLATVRDGMSCRLGCFRPWNRGRFGADLSCLSAQKVTSRAVVGVCGSIWRTFDLLSPNSVLSVPRTIIEHEPLEHEYLCAATTIYQFPSLVGRGSCRWGRDHSVCGCQPLCLALSPQERGLQGKFNLYNV
jgi:hypothetical protein